MTPASCPVCEADLAFLRSQQRPTTDPDAQVVTAVDLFSGCGGMSLGLAEGARRLGRRLEVRLAVDTEARALDAFGANLDVAVLARCGVDELFAGACGEDPTELEAWLADGIGELDWLVGGPPCQGHSDLNNHTRRADPKNALYLRMARAAEVLRPRFVLIENVPAVRHDSSGVVKDTIAALEKVDYRVGASVLRLQRLGVPQTRKRYVVLAVAEHELDPQVVLDSLDSRACSHPRTVGWAIGDLEDAVTTQVMSSAPTPSVENEARMAVLFDRGLYDLPNEHRPRCHRDKEHTYNSVYGRLRWDDPAQTITTGFGSMGQGRYVHPSRPRTITPREAARLQTFPDWFDFSTDRRGALGRMIGNAVPPLLMARVVGAVDASSARG